MFKRLADFNGDGKADLVFEDATGNYAAWLIDDTHILQGATIGSAARRGIWCEIKK